MLTDQPTTVIGEWLAGSHLNLGDGPDATKSIFLARMQALLSR
jgi:hypothetical protein